MLEKLKLYIAYKNLILHLLTGLEERREALKYLNVLVVQWIQSESLRHKAELEQ